MESITKPALTGQWRINHGILCCGTLRIASFDFDTDPSEEFKQAVYRQMLERLNGETQAARASVQLNGISQDPAIRSGVPCLAGHRVPVALMLADLISGGDLRSWCDDRDIDLDLAIAAMNDLTRLLGEPFSLPLRRQEPDLDTIARSIDDIERGRYRPVEAVIERLQEDLATVESLKRQLIKTETQLKESHEAIRRHRDYRGDDRCHGDDDELYATLPEGWTPRERDTAVELERCRQFIACRHNPATVYISPQRRIEELEHQIGDIRTMLRDIVVTGGDARGIVLKSHKGLSDALIAIAGIALREHPADDDKSVTADWLLSLDGFYRQGDHYERNLSADGFWKIVVDLEEPPDLSIMHKRDWLSCVKINATRGDVRQLCQALGIELKG